MNNYEMQKDKLQEIRSKIKRKFDWFGELSEWFFKNKREILDDVLLKYADVLSAKENRLIYKDEYGDYIFDEWEREVTAFIENKCSIIFELIDETIPSNYETIDRNDDIFSITKKIIDIYIGLSRDTQRKMEKGGQDQSISEMSGADFEDFIKSVLENMGWSVLKTPTTGDQGADLIAERSGKKIAIQCKNWSTPVGNSAIQEVYTSLKYYGCSFGFVISANGFTTAARQIATAASIEIVEIHEIQKVFA